MPIPEDVKITPWLDQYKGFKERYPDALLLFRMGDFYELFFEDARKAASVLDIALTSRDSERKIPMAGIPYHALNIYLGRLIKAGCRVAICEQMSDTPPKGAKVVERKVIRVVTPGTYVPAEEDNLNSGRLAAVTLYKGRIAMAFLSVDTGGLEAGTLAKNDAEALLSAFAPGEVLYPSGALTQKLFERMPVLANYAPHAVSYDLFKVENAVMRLKSALKLKSLEAFGFKEDDPCLGCAWAALDYLSATQFSSARHVLRIRPLALRDRMNLDETAQYNLELIPETSQSGASLFSSLDKCRTPMGRRTLREWILRPLMDVNAIKRRQDAIGALINMPDKIAPLQDLLAGTRDIERALSRLSLGSGNPRDLAAIRDTLKIIPEFINFDFGDAGPLNDLIKAFPAPGIQDLSKYLDDALEDELPWALNTKPVIRSSFNEELASWREALERGSDWLNEYLEREREASETPRLKTGYTHASGYYLEIGKMGLKRTPPYFERRQTLANSERYTTPELREFQDRMAHSGENIARLEGIIYQEVIDRVINYSSSLQTTGKLLGILDCVASNAMIARERGYSRPDVNNSMGINVKAGRHPVLETLSDGAFVPNDIVLNETEARIIILTGPNMAGKSTWLRTAALLAVMAQAGLWIPAESAEIGLVDRVFTRIGARDDLARGSSTFMVEMLETANILNNATERSLVILDEVGRGTATWDGMSIAWAVLEFLLYERPRTRVLFATHYHELTCLENINNANKNNENENENENSENAENYENNKKSEKNEYNGGIKNYSMAVSEGRNGISFLHQVVEGPADRSYGIEVARLAGLPATVLRRACELLDIFEKSEINNLDKLNDFRSRIPDELKQLKRRSGQINLFSPDPEAYGIIEQLCGLDLDNITPMQSLAILNKLKDKAEKASAF